MERTLNLIRDSKEINNLLSSIQDQDNAASIEWEDIYGWKIVITDEGQTIDIYLPRWINLAVDRKIRDAANYQKKRKWWQLF